MQDESETKMAKPGGSNRKILIEIDTDELMAWIDRSAKRNRRSAKSEVLYALESYYRSRAADEQLGLAEYGLTQPGDTYESELYESTKAALEKLTEALKDLTAEKDAHSVKATAADAPKTYRSEPVNMATRREKKPQGKRNPLTPTQAQRLASAAINDTDDGKLN